ncbi:hypothetical protein [Streptosporangium vulgare]|uniref:hypothetical protein n=1 Tax=Streptosporangium vulgare TaxID=46190 RepID=UPI0031D04C33
MIAIGTSGIVNDASHHTGLPTTQGTMTVAIAASVQTICPRSSRPARRNRAAIEAKARIIIALVSMSSENRRGWGALAYRCPARGIRSVTSTSAARTATEPQTSARQRGDGGFPSG